MYKEKIINWSTLLLSDIVNYSMVTISHDRFQIENVSMINLPIHYKNNMK